MNDYEAAMLELVAQQLDYFAEIADARAELGEEYVAPEGATAKVLKFPTQNAMRGPV